MKTYGVHWRSVMPTAASKARSGIARAARALAKFSRGCPQLPRHGCAPAPGIFTCCVLELRDAENEM